MHRAVVINGNVAALLLMQAMQYHIIVLIVNLNAVGNPVEQ
jgi:hypothetical protein